MIKGARKIRIITNVVTVSIVVAILSGCAGLKGGSTQKKAEDPSLKNGMRTAEVKVGDIGTNISGSGSFVPVKVTSLLFNDLSGPLKKLYVKTNDEIKAGNPVAEIDPQSIYKKIADQNIIMKISKFRNLQNNEDILMSARNLKLAKMNLDKATRSNKETPTDENSQELIRQQILYDQAVSADKNTKWNKDIADIQINHDESNLTDLHKKLAESTLKSPVDGIVTFVENYSETEMVTSGHLIAQVTESKNIVLQMLTTDSRFFQNVNYGDLIIGSENYSVELYTPQPGDQLTQASYDQKTNNRIYIKFSQTMPKITWENTVNATLRIKKSNVLIVPKAALHDLNGKTVVDIVKGNVVDTVEVERGLEQDGNVEILSGLEAEQTVILQ